MSVIATAAPRLVSLLYPRARSSSKYSLTAGHVQRIRQHGLWPLFVREGERTKLSPYLLAGIAWGESDFVPDALNPTTKAAGLMQVMPFHFQSLGWSGRDWADPAKNIRAGADILAYQVRVRGSIERGLAGYGGFSSWLAGKPVSGPTDPAWYIDEAMGRAFLLELMHRAGTLQL